MDQVNWLRELPERAMLFDREARVVVIEREQWERISAYNFSVPTGPSAGRVYRREGAERTAYFRQQATNYPQERDYLFVCVACEDACVDAHPEPRRGFVDHIPYEALVID